VKNSIREKYVRKLEKRENDRGKRNCEGGGGVKRNRLRNARGVSKIGGYAIALYLQRIFCDIR